MRSYFRVICIGIGGGLIALADLSAQPAARAQATNPSIQPPIPRPAVGFFRELLMMTPAECERALAATPEDKRKTLLEKVTEYKMMPAAEREHRLQLLELWSTLVPLMQMRPEDRAPMLSRIPENERQLIEERLQQWDLLPSEVQQEVLENKLTIHYFIRLETGPPLETELLLKTMSEESRKNLEKKLDEWRALPAERRETMYQQFRRFFELPPGQKEKTLDALPEEERLQMEKSLEQFTALSPAHRQMCIDAFGKLAGMSKEERAQFLRNAERWNAMSAQERATWRNLVHLLPRPSPPMPDGTGGTRTPPMGSNRRPSVPLPGVGK